MVVLVLCPEHGGNFPIRKMIWPFVLKALDGNNPQTYDVVEPVEENH